MINGPSQSVISNPSEAIASRTEHRIIALETLRKSLSTSCSRR
ncbi:hypothetical protein [Moorena sp. SIO1G6]|nr:hypothetical protein [Moorena sp. SIO1G6]